MSITQVSSRQNRRVILTAVFLCCGAIVVTAVSLPGWIYRISGCDFSNAQTILNSVERLFPSPYDWHLKRADSLLGEIKYSAATMADQEECANKALEDAVQLQPYWPEAYAKRAELNAVLIMKLSGSNAEGAKSLVANYRARCENDFDKAVEFSSGARRAEYLLHRARCLSLTRTSDEIIADCDSALLCDPHNAQSRIMRANQYMQETGRPDRYGRAIEDYKAALSAGTDRRLDCFIGLARAYAGLADNAAVIKYCTDALEILERIDYQTPNAFPENEALHRQQMLELRAKAYAVRGQHLLAEKDLEQSRKIPDRPPLSLAQSVLEYLKD